MKHRWQSHKRWKRGRRRRDAAVRPAAGARPRTLPQYHRETAALLIAGHHFHHAKAIRALGRWRGFVYESWKRGKPPCWTSDHVAKYEHAGALPMSGGFRRDGGRNTKSRKAGAVLIQRGKVVGRYSSRGKALLAGKSLVRRTGRLAFVVSKGAVRGTRRDSPGDVYESRSGNRWEVISLTEGGKVKVRRTGHKQSGELIWGKGVLGSMKKVGHEKVPAAVAEPKEKGFFGGLLAPDPDRRSRARRWRRRSRR